MSNEQKSGGAAGMVIKLVVGVAAMLGGYYLHKQHVFESIEHPLAEQGILLDIGKTISIVGVFLIVFPLLNMFYFKPYRDAVQERTSTLEATFDEAEQLKQRMGDLKASYEEKLAQSEAEARTEIQKAVSEAQQMKETIISDARAQADEVRKRGVEELERERQKALVDMKVQVVEMTLQATEKLVGEVSDRDRQKQLVEKFIDTVEVGK
jgi:F-type H+-transporting ATPase subunit b